MPDDTGTSPYKRFESFLKRLVAVPKAEIDAKAAEQKGKPRSAFPSNERRRMHEQAQP